MTETAGKSFSSVLRILPPPKQADSKEVAAIVRVAEEDSERVVVEPKSDQPTPPALEFSLACTVDSSSYNKLVSELVENTLLGFHGTAITLGPSCSHARGFFGDPVGGVVARGCRQILRCIKRSQNNRSVSNLVVLCSYLLVTDDSVQDLLQQGDQAADKMAVEKRGVGVIVDGKEVTASIVQVKSASDVARLLTRGSEVLLNKAGSGQPTCHTVFTIRVEYAQFGSMAAPVSGTLSLVDLGVSDQFQGTDKHTSESLSAFADTIKSLTSQKHPSLPSPTSQPHVHPLTQLLREALGGNCKTLLLCDVPDQIPAAHYDACLETMSLTSRARHIENKPDRTELARKALMDAYMKELRRIHGSGELKRSQSENKDGIQLAANALVAAAKGSANIDEEDTDIDPMASLSLSRQGPLFLRQSSTENKKRISLKPKKRSTEDMTVDTLVAVLQDPDKGAPRANMTNLKNVKTHRGKGAVFTGAAIVAWLLENIDGAESIEDAECLGQILLDKGAIFHSEGSSVFANAESLCYYAKEARNVGKLLSLDEIKALLAKNKQVTSITQVSDIKTPQEEQASDDTHQYFRHVSISSDQSSMLTQSTGSSLTPFDSSYNSRMMSSPPQSPNQPSDTSQYLHLQSPNQPSDTSQYLHLQSPNQPSDTSQYLHLQGTDDGGHVEEVDMSTGYSEEHGHVITSMPQLDPVISNTGQEEKHLQDIPEEPEKDTSSDDEGAPDTAPVLTVPTINTLESDDQYPHPLHYAAALGSKSGVLRHLINWYGVDMNDDYNRTPLMFGALGNKASVCRTLISSGAVIDHRDNSGLTALHIASYHGSNDVLKVLLHRNANPAISDKLGHNVLHWSALSTNPDGLKILLKYCQKHMLNQEDKGGLTPLHWAIFSDHPDHLTTLLQWSDSTNNIGTLDTFGRSLLTYAIQKSAFHCIQVLLDHSPALLCLADKNGLMPIHHAAARETADYMNTILTALNEKSLLEVDCKDDQGRTPLHYATLYNNLGVVQMLLTNGAGTQAEDNEGKTPLELLNVYGVAVDDDITQLLEADVSELTELLRNNTDVPEKAQVDALNQSSRRLSRTQNNSATCIML